MSWKAQKTYTAQISFTIEIPQRVVDSIEDFALEARRNEEPINKITLIKYLRENTRHRVEATETTVGLSLKDAKEIVEDIISGVQP